MPFIPPMLATRLEDPRRLADPRYIAEPKLDGQRAQFRVRGGRVVAWYSRPGRDLLHHAGFAWLRELAWPFNEAVFDGEAVAGDGHERMQAVFTERQRAGAAMAVVLFEQQEQLGGLELEVRRAHTGEMEHAPLQPLVPQAEARAIPVENLQPDREASRIPHTD